VRGAGCGGAGRDYLHLAEDLDTCWFSRTLRQARHVALARRRTRATWRRAFAAVRGTTGVRGTVARQSPLGSVLPPGTGGPSPSEHADAPFRNSSAAIHRREFVAARSVTFESALAVHAAMSVVRPAPTRGVLDRVRDGRRVPGVRSRRGPAGSRRQHRRGDRGRRDRRAKARRCGLRGYRLSHSRSRRSRKRRSGSCCVSDSARSYDLRASADRPSRRHKSACAECARW